MTTDPGTQDPFSFDNLERTFAGSQKASNLALGALPLLARLVFAVLTIAAGSLAAMATPLLRTRMGVSAIFILGPTGALLLALCVQIARHSPLHPLMLGWLLLLWLVSLVQFLRGLQRLAVPNRSNHVHRWSGGQPRRIFNRIWWRVLGDRAGDPRWLVLVAEPVFLVAVAIALAIAEWFMGGSEGVPVWVIPLAAAAGDIAQGIIQAARSAWRLQLLRDQQEEQTDLSKTMLAVSTDLSEREAEGVASIPTDE